MTGPKSKWARRVDRPTTVCASRNRRSPASWFAGLARLFDFIIWVSIQLEKGLAVVCLHSCFVPSSFIDEKDWFDCIVSTRFLSSLVFLEFSLKCVVLSEEWSASLVWLSIRAPCFVLSQFPNKMKLYPCMCAASCTIVSSVRYRRTRVHCSSNAEAVKISKNNVSMAAHIRETRENIEFIID